MKLKNTSLLCLLLMLSTAAQAQFALWGVNAKLYGFVNNFFCYDSRRSLMVAEDLFNILPLDASYDAAGHDTNADPSVKFLAMTTRIGVDLTGPEVFGANTTAKIETDFGGYSATGTLLRIRQAYTALEWQDSYHSQLLVGQTWHPMSGDLKPDVFSLATGSPFNPFNRSPMIRYDYWADASIMFTTAAIYQFQYASVGMNGAPSYTYSRRGLWPEVYVGMTLGGKTAPTALGFDVSSIKIGDSRITSYAAMLSTSQRIGRVDIKAKGVCGENLSHMLLPSGFGMDSADSHTLLPLTAAAAWTTIMYNVPAKNSFRIGLMAGWLKNLGVRPWLKEGDRPTIVPSSVRIWGNHAGVSSSLGEMYRISPMATYRVKNLMLGLELEHTAACYGDMQLNGTVNNLHTVANNRVCALMMYNF